jgi:hypothetical protein
MRAKINARCDFRIFLSPFPLRDLAISFQPSGAREVTTIFQAEMDGTLTAMSSNAKREVPDDYAQRQALREAWENAFDKMRQELRGTPVEAPKGAKEPTEPKKARKPKAAPQEAPEPVPTVAEKPKTMADILAVSHHEAKEYV